MSEETKKLLDRMRYWENKVGIRIPGVNNVS
jgi:hypothetical protein